MELDESVEREKLVSEGEDDDPSPLETVAHVPTKPVIPVPQSVIMSTKKNSFPGELCRPLNNCMIHFHLSPFQ